VAGDILYGGKIPEMFGLQANRQLLHSSVISFVHPETGDTLTYTSPLWPDMQEILDILRRKEAQGE